MRGAGDEGGVCGGAGVAALGLEELDDGYGLEGGGPGGRGCGCHCVLRGDGWEELVLFL